MQRIASTLLFLALALDATSLSYGSTFAALNIDFLGRGGGPQGLVARPGELANVFWNPSGLGFSGVCGGFAGFMDYLVATKGGTAGYKAAVGQGFGYGLYVSYLSSGTLTRTAWDDPVGDRGETFSHGEVVAGLSGGVRLLPCLSVGMGLKVARQNLDDVASAGMFGDVSGTLRMYPFGGSRPSGVVAYGTVVVRNVVLKRWPSQDGQGPRNSEFGVALEFPRQSLATGFSFSFGRDGRREMRFGVSALLSEEFEARVGYRRRTGSMSDEANGLPWERGLTAGFGISFGSVWIDYTYEDASPLDNIHRFAIRAVKSAPRLN